MMFVLCICAVPLLIVCINVLSWHRPSAELCTESTSSVSVLIPARNEEHNIGPCVEHVYSSTHLPIEVIVYNDGSTDSTMSVLSSLQDRFDSLNVIQGVPLPFGWAGKNHACHQLAQHATGDVLLFLDADTRLEPSGITHLLTMSNHPKLPSDLVSALPKQIMVTWGERLVMPFLQLTLLAWLPLEFVRRLSFPSMTAAIGQVVAIKRSAYNQSGGFAAIPNELVDDMALATRFKKLGLTVRFIDGYNTARCRMYTSLSQIWNGFSKNMFIGLNENIPLWLFVIILYSTCFILPFFLMCLYPWLSQQTIIVLLGCIMVNYTIRMLIALRYGHSWLSVLSHPVASIIVIGIFLNSGLQTMNGAIEWKGRTYGSAKS